MKKKEKLIYTVLLITIGLLFTSCCPLNPGLNTVVTAHGNTDWHIDTAEEFLTGAEMDGTTSASNHCPNTWTKTHMHVSLTNTNNYYYDVGKVATGKDNDPANGIDRAMLFFYAGHGGPTGFDALGNSAVLSNMKIGNCESGNHGKLRYYWQCSCKVFAHGPLNCSGRNLVYACPEDFDGSSDSPNMRNVYERWGSILSPELRMACGSSTLAWCHESQTNKIWDYYNNQGYEVADAFIFGLKLTNSWNTPLCITTGGRMTSSTPLFDQTFTNQPNPSGSFLHIQYLSEFDNNVPMIVVAIPEMLPIYYLIPQPLPDKYDKYRFENKKEWMYSESHLKEREIPVVKINNNSGSIYFYGERRFDEASIGLNEDEFLKLANDFLEEQSWTEAEVSNPYGQKMIIESVPKTGEFEEESKTTQKSATVVFKRQIIIDDEAVNTVGEGGKISIQFNNDGTVYNASKVWRKIKEVKTTTEAKQYDQAFEEALQQVKERDAYKLDNWTWGYEEFAGNVEQTELKAIYLFNFIPVNEEISRDYPPMMIKVSAHIE